MSLYQRLKGHAEFQPEKLAIDFDGEAISYRSLHRRVEFYVDHFTRLGLVEGDRVAFLAMNHPDMFAVVFAAAYKGVVLVPLNWRLSVDELDYVIADCSPSLLLHDHNFSETAAQLGEANSQRAQTMLMENISDVSNSENQADAVGLCVSASTEQMGSEAVLTRPLLIVYTSGTTGRPKGAVLNQKAVLCSAEMSRHMLDLTSADRVLNVLPLFHVGGLNIQPLPTLLYGASLYLHSRFDPAASVTTIANSKITYINTVPTLLAAMLDCEQWETADICSLRAVSIGSTDVPASLIHRVHNVGLPLIQVYGATETSPVAIYQRKEHAKYIGSIGRAGLLCEIRLCDADNAPVPIGVPGEIQVKGDNILSYYWNNTDATNSSIVDGWFKTGDIAHLDHQGFYWFDDRVKHVIISGGENIYPAELERVIREVPGVDAVSVVGEPNERWGEVPVAVVVGSVSESEIINACTQLARFKQPKKILLVDDLPRNALGKVQVQLVKDLVLQMGSKQ